MTAKDMLGPYVPKVDVVGVDGCLAGWIAARLSPHAPQFVFSIHATFTHLLNAFSSIDHIAVDIPIGLSNCFTARQCDQEARARLGPRRSSVFPAPDRSLLNHKPYAAANAFSRKQCGKGISQQSFHLFLKIAEVDALITPSLQGRIFEVHPELCFLTASGNHPLQHSKRTAEGYEERRRILEKHFPSAAIPARSEVRKELPGATSKDVQPDDILDAMIAAWTALRHSLGQHQRIPAVPEHDARGLRMEILY